MDFGTSMKFALRSLPLVKRQIGLHWLGVYTGAFKTWQGLQQGAQPYQTLLFKPYRQWLKLQQHTNTPRSSLFSEGCRTCDDAGYSGYCPAITGWAAK